MSREKKDPKEEIKRKFQAYTINEEFIKKMQDKEKERILGQPGGNTKTLDDASTQHPAAKAENTVEKVAQFNKVREVPAVSQLKASSPAPILASQPSSIEKINVDVLAGELNAIQKNFQNPESRRHLPKGWTHLLEDGFNKKLIEKGSQEIVKLLPSISFPEEMFEDMNKEIKYREEAIKELERKKVNKATKIFKPKDAAEKVIQRHEAIERLNVQKSEIEDSIDVIKIRSYISKSVEAAQDLAQKTRLDPNNLVAETFFQTQDFLESQYPEQDLTKLIKHSKDGITNGNADLAKAFKALEVTRGKKDAAKQGVGKMVKVQLGK